MDSLAFIIWNASPDLGFAIGSLAPRWYGLLFASGFFFGLLIMTRIFRAEGKPEPDLDALLLYMLVSTVVGARLGHCLFYQADYYLANPLEILKVWEGGLASHGGTVGILLGIWLYSRSRRATGQTYLWVLDRIVIVVALGGCLIRLGNFVNGEIIGKPTNFPAAVVFANWLEQRLEGQEERGDLVGFERIVVTRAGADTVVDGQTLMPLTVKLEFDRNVSGQAKNGAALTALTGSLFQTGEVANHYRAFGRPKLDQPTMNEFVFSQVFGIPRHPAQLYEAISCFLLFLFLWALWRKYQAATPRGLLFGLFVVILFGLRFMYEFLKENQVDFENNLPLNQGQNLSIPMIIVGIIVLVRVWKNRGQAPA
jgi:phosphatidylglycerol---prolipoprotein diacylglyceryl transferase